MTSSPGNFFFFSLIRVADHYFFPQETTSFPEHNLGTCDPSPLIWGMRMDAWNSEGVPEVQYTRARVATFCCISIKSVHNNFMESWNIEQRLIVRQSMIDCSLSFPLECKMFVFTILSHGAWSTVGILVNGIT